MGLLAIWKSQSTAEQLFGKYLSPISNPDKHIRKDEVENLVNEVGLEVFSFISKYLNVSEKENFVTATTTSFNINNLPEYRYNNIVNIKKVNDARYVNKFFESVNEKLDKDGLYINCIETYATRRTRVLKKFIRPFNWLYYVADVVFMRIFPKLPITKQLYFFITRGKNRVLTRAEAFGRLYSCGFEIVDEKTIGNKLYFVAKKVKAPAFDKDPSYGILVRLKRVGKNGNIFNVYKLRTMHAYAEYLQEYVHKQNSLNGNGKIKNDFRISPGAKFLRRFWLDEIPMLLNILKGDMKIVGVRPLSPHYFNLYHEDLQQKRTKHLPGLIPPYYADMPTDLDEIMASEMRYLESYEKRPFTTDVRYFCKAFCNIVFKGARSC